MTRHLAWLLAPLVGLLVRPPTAGATEPSEIYPHKSFTAQEFGAGARSYWLFEPDAPRPESAPVVVFSHGWLSMNPGLYGAWVEHLARRGHTVVYPRYQADGLTPPADYLPNAVHAIRDALEVLQTGLGHVRPRRDRFALVGHSAGGNLSAQLAATAADAGLPEPRAVVAVMPGEVRIDEDFDFGRIPTRTLLVVIVGDRDALVGDALARRIHAETPQVSPERKAYLHYRTDRDGPVPLVADHFAPLAGLPRLDTGEGPFRAFQMNRAGVDLLDRFGFWRVADVTIAAGFSGVTLAAATADGESLRDLGRWSDGRAVTPPLVGNDLESIPRIPSAGGVRELPRSPEEFFRALLKPPPAAVERTLRTARGADDDATARR